MNKHNLNLSPLALITTLLLSVNANATTQSVDSIALSKNVHLLRVNSNMGNTSSVISTGEQGVLLIDPNFDGSSALIQQKINQLSPNATIKYLTSTHVHRDHTEQYANFLTQDTTAIVPVSQRQELAKAAYMQGQLPNATFKGQTTLYLNNNSIHLRTLPKQKGHTNGDLVAYFEQDKLLYVGDYLFIERYPIIDKHLGDIDGYFANIKHILDTYPTDTIIIPGHSSFEPAPLKTLTMEQYRQYYNDLLASIAYIKKQKQAGKSQAEVIKQGLPEQFARYQQKPRFVSEQKWIERVW